MAEKDPVSLDALNGLLKERQRYEEWLAALDENFRIGVSTRAGRLSDAPA